MRDVPLTAEQVASARVRLMLPAPIADHACNHPFESCWRCAHDEALRTLADSHELLRTSLARVEAEREEAKQELDCQNGDDFCGLETPCRKHALAYWERDRADSLGQYEAWKAQHDRAGKAETEREEANARTYETMQNWNETLAQLERSEAEAARLREERDGLAHDLQGARYESASLESALTYLRSAVDEALAKCGYRSNAEDESGRDADRIDMLFDALKLAPAADPGQGQKTAENTVK